MPKVGITDTILRDAHQSQAATRMKLSEMLPMCPVLDSAAIGLWNAGEERRLFLLKDFKRGSVERLRQLKAGFAQH